MAEEIYVKLRDKFDTIGFGYSPTETGVEFTFLERFFTPEDAEIFLAMDASKYVYPSEVAEVMNRPEDEISAAMSDMSYRGIIFRSHDEAGTPIYRCAPIAHGVYEFQVNNIEDGWSKGLSKHYMQGWGKRFYGTETPMFRSIPVNEDVVMGGSVLPADNIWEILKTKRRFAVTDCMCRKRNMFMGKDEHHDLENCLSFDTFADYYIENGIAREITYEETVDIVKKGIKQGCVLSADDSKNIEVLCICCSCACGLIGALKYFPGPANKKVSNYYITKNEDACRPSCSHVCVRRCPMGAWSDKTGELTLNIDRCIGCGLCVTTCPGKALKLKMKDQEDIYEPQADTLFDAYEQMAHERGVR